MEPARAREQGEQGDWLIRVGMAANRLFTRVYHRVEQLTPCTLPPHGPAILACNHTSGLDPLLIQSASRRVIVWMMAREYYEMPSLNWMLRRIEAIPVGRSGRDMAAMRGALRALKSGRIVGIFPEGRIERRRELMPFQTGAALMAIRAGVQVYPACLDGTQRNRSMLQSFLQAQTAQLAFGPPLHLGSGDPGRKDLELATARLQAAIAGLMDLPQPSADGSVA